MNVFQENASLALALTGWLAEPLPHPLFPVHFTCFRAIFLFPRSLSPLLSLPLRLSWCFYFYLISSNSTPILDPRLFIRAPLIISSARQPISFLSHVTRRTPLWTLCQHYFWVFLAGTLYEVKVDLWVVLTFLFKKL